MTFQPETPKNRTTQTSALDLSACLFGGSASLNDENTLEPTAEQDVYQEHAASEKVVRDLVMARRLDLVKRLEALGTGVEVTPDALLSCKKIEGGSTFQVRLTHTCGTDTCFEISAKDGSERNIGMTYFPITANSPVNASGWNRTGTSLSVDALLDLAFG